jgi:hypothetical protein
VFSGLIFEPEHANETASANREVASQVAQPLGIVAVEGYPPHLGHDAAGM